MSATIGIVTETWLTDGADLEEEVENLGHGTGYGMLYQNRKANDRGYSHGGVALLYLSLIHI